MPQALHTVVLADRYGARALKEAALDVAADHLKQLRQRPEWGDFARHHHELVAELMGVLADKLEAAQQAVLAQHADARDARDAVAVAASRVPVLGPLGHGDVFGQIFVGPGQRALRFP